MSRAESTVLGALLLTALTLVLAAVAGVAVVDSTTPAEAPRPIVLSASALVDDGTVVVAIVHQGGPGLDVHEIEVRISVGGDRLDEQPPVPFYSAPGYASFPSGPFNPVADPRWEVGERASLTITGENAASIEEGATVRIEIYRDGLRVGTVETPAR